MRRAGIDRPRWEARLLMAHLLGMTQDSLLRALDAPIDGAAFDALVGRRAAHEPLARIVGHREFWSLEFAVSPATLIPRPDSETLVEAAVRQRPGGAGVRRVLDLGTGTGCLLLAVLSEFPGATGLGIDLVPDAAALAASNARALGLESRAVFLCGNWDDAIDARFDLVLSNPPYIASADLATLDPDVRVWEPASALDGGEDGLAAYRRILARLPVLLAPDGLAVLEIGVGQDEAVRGLAAGLGLDGEAVPDLAGIPRAVLLRRRA